MQSIEIEFLLRGYVCMLGNSNAVWDSKLTMHPRKGYQMILQLGLLGTATKLLLVTFGGNFSGFGGISRGVLWYDRYKQHLFRWLHHLELFLLPMWMSSCFI
jgi:hypothetical protein